MDTGSEVLSVFCLFLHANQHTHHGYVCVLDAWLKPRGNTPELKREQREKGNTGERDGKKKGEEIPSGEKSP